MANLSIIPPPRAPAMRSFFSRSLLGCSFLCLSAAAVPAVAQQGPYDNRPPAVAPQPTSAPYYPAPAGQVILAQSTSPYPGNGNLAPDAPTSRLPTAAANARVAGLEQRL